MSCVNDLMFKDISENAPFGKITDLVNHEMVKNAET